MSATVEVSPGEHIPLKCVDHNAAGVPRTDCTEPGSKLRCQLCPASPTFWLRAERAAEGTLRNSGPCPNCGLKSWDADDLNPGDMVCTCKGPFEEDA